MNDASLFSSVLLRVRPSLASNNGAARIGADLPPFFFGEIGASDPPSFPARGQISSSLLAAADAGKKDKLLGRPLQE